jgi:hypothetical protein
MVRGRRLVLKASFCKANKFCYNLYMIKKIIFPFALVAFVQIPTISFADDYSDYDSIVEELSSSSRYTASSTSSDPFDQIRFHAGVSLVASRVGLDLPKGLPANTNLRGVQAHLGIDLFSPNWVAQGSVRSFSPEPFLSGEVSVREFSLEVVHHFRPGSRADLTIGGGMGARYLDITEVEGPFQKSNTTPVSILSLGLNSNVSSGINIGGNISYRSALVNESVDEDSVDAGIHFGGRF